MAPRQVTVCEDETFHPGICLVAIEPVSNFILLEHYAADRTAATWTVALQGACRGLAMEVIQSTADEAKALRRHVDTDLGAHHSPDPFQGQHEVSKATSLALACNLRQAEADVAAVQVQWEAEREARQVFKARVPRPLGRPPCFEAHIAAALSKLVARDAERDRAQAGQAAARELIREVVSLYHSYDPQTVHVRPVERVAARFTAAWLRLKQLAEAADRPERARAWGRRAKAERLTVQWLTTLAFFFATVTARVEALALPLVLEAAVLELNPAMYVELVATCSTAAAPRHRVQASSTALVDALARPDHPLQRLASEASAHVEHVAGVCADLFQRGSACVEGRSGQLSLYHHGRHRLSDRRLAAQTAVQNFYIRRVDGTSAAERFFGRTHPAPLEQILVRVPLPPRPRRRRPRPPKLPYLMPVAA